MKSLVSVLYFFLFCFCTRLLALRCLRIAILPHLFFSPIDTRTSMYLHASRAGGSKIFISADEKQTLVQVFRN
jgi:hypothetical protein